MTKGNIFSISSETEFTNTCLETFRYQARECEPYARYLSYIGVEVEAVDELNKIPFLPIEFFKSEKIICGNSEPQITFTSSGTTGDETSHHHVTDVELYEQSFLYGFEKFYGKVEDYCVLALLPGYMERQGSSLIYMVQKLVEKSAHSQSGFYLYNHEDLIKTLVDLRVKNQPTILVGVTFALLDLVEKMSGNLCQGNQSNIIVMETGGMKGRRKEMPREELHQTICNALCIKSIHSEYGMTELLSQAYSKGDGVFFAPPWMRILVRDLYNPFSSVKQGAAGGINVIDLANRNSCSFIETQDLGRILSNGGFEILGRIDRSQIRGCNMLVGQ